MKGHTPVHGLNWYRMLCVQNKYRKGTNGNLWRGHRTTICFQVCLVNVCARVYSGLRKICRATWHSTKNLLARETSCSERNNQDESDGEDDAIDGFCI